MAMTTIPYFRRCSKSSMYSHKQVKLIYFSLASTPQADSKNTPFYFHAAHQKSVGSGFVFNTACALQQRWSKQIASIFLRPPSSARLVFQTIADNSSLVLRPRRAKLTTPLHPPLPCIHPSPSTTDKQWDVETFASRWRMCVEFSCIYKFREEQFKCARGYGMGDVPKWQKWQDVK